MSVGEIANVYATIGADITGLEKGLQAAETQLGGFSSTMSAWGKGLQNAGAAISVAVGLPAMGFVRGITQAAADFESEMNIMAGVAGNTGLSMDSLGDIAIAVGNDVNLIGIDAMEAADAMTNFFKAGMTASDVLGDYQGYLTGTAQLGGALRASIDLAAASNVDLATSSMLVATAMKTYGMEEAEATRIADLFVAGADASMAEVSDLGDALANIGPIAAAYGMDLEETLTLLAALADKGIIGAEAGTALKSMFQSLHEPTAAVTEALKELDVELYNSDKSARNQVDVLGDIARALYEDKTVVEEYGGATAEQAKQIDSLTGKLTTARTKLNMYEAGVYDATTTEAARAKTMQKLRDEIGYYESELDSIEVAGLRYVRVTKEMTDADRDRLSYVIAGAYGAKAFAALIDDQGNFVYDEYATKMGMSADAQELAAQRTQGLNAAIEQLQGGIQTFMIMAGTPFIEKFATPVVGVLVNVVNALSLLPADALANLGAIAAGLVALGPTLVGVGTGLRVLAFLGPTLATAGGVIALVAGAVLLLCDAGNDFVKGLWQWDEAIYKLFGVEALDRWIKFRKGLEEVSDAIRGMPSGKTFAAWLDIKPGATTEETWRNIGTTMWARIQEGADRVASGAWLAGLLGVDIGRTDGETWGNIGGELWERLTTGLPVVVGGFIGRMMGWDIDATQASTWSGLGANVWARVRDGLSATWQGVGNWVADLLKVPEPEGDQAGWDEVGRAVKEKFEQALVRFLPGIDWDAVLTPAAGGLQLLGLMGAFGTAVRDALGTVDWGLTFTTLWAGLSDGIGAGLLALVGGSKIGDESAWEALERVLSGAFTAVFGAIDWTGAVDAIWTGLQTAWGQIKGGHGLAGLLGIAPQEGETGWEAIGRTIIDGIVGGMTTAHTIGVAVWQGLVTGFRAAYTGLGEIILSFLEGEGLERSLSNGLKVATEGLPQKMRYEMGGALGAAAEGTGEDSVWTRIGRRIWEMIVDGMRDAMAALGGLGLSAGEFLLGLLGGAKAGDETVYQALGRTMWEGIQQGLEAAAGMGVGAYEWLAGAFQGASDYITTLLAPDESGETPLLKSMRGLGERMWEAITGAWTTVEGSVAYQAVADAITGITTDPKVVAAVNGIKGFFSTGGFLDVLFGGGEPTRGTGEAAEDVVSWVEGMARDVGVALGAEMAEGEGTDALVQQWRNNFQAIWEKVWTGMRFGGGLGAALGRELRGQTSNKDLVKGAMMLGGGISAVITDFLTCGTETLADALRGMRDSGNLRDAAEMLGGSLGGLIAGVLGGFFAKAENGRPLVVALLEGMCDAVVEGLVEGEILGLAIQRLILSAIVDSLPEGWLGDFIREGMEGRIEHIDIIIGAHDVQVSQDAQKKITSQIKAAVAEGAAMPSTFALGMLETVPPALSVEPVTEHGTVGGIESNYEAMWNNMLDHGVPSELVWFLEQFYKLPGMPGAHLQGMRDFQTARDWLFDREMWKQDKSPEADIAGLGHVPGLHVPTYPNMGGAYPGDTGEGGGPDTRPYQIMLPVGVDPDWSLKVTGQLAEGEGDMHTAGVNAGSAYGSGFRTGYEAAMNLNLDAFSAKMLKMLRAAGVPY